MPLPHRAPATSPAGPDLPMPTRHAEPTRTNATNRTAPVLRDYPSHAGASHSDMPNQSKPNHPPDWKVGDQVAVTKDHHPVRKGVIARVLSLHVMVSCESLHGRLLKFSTKTGRKVAPYAQTSTWIRPWTSRDQELEDEVHRLMQPTTVKE